MADLGTVAITEYEHACGLDSAGIGTCWNIQPHPPWGDNAVGAMRVLPGQAATAIGADGYNGCALLADGTVSDGRSTGRTLSLRGSAATSTGWSAVDLQNASGALR
jgi:hypothetical protein